MSHKKQSLHAHYERMVALGSIQNDAAQRDVLHQLEALSAQLAKKPRGIFAKKTAPAAGIYIWGSVGRGKSMLMDLFYAHAPVAKKRRVHFHAFMQEVHARIHQLRQEGRGDPVMLLARALAAESPLLCFDELQATDVADASLLHRLFTGMFEAGVVVVSTSNHPPQSLYTGGVQRERFNAFIALIESHMKVAALPSPEDYRHKQGASAEQVYFSPLGSVADAFIEAAISARCADPTPHKDMLSVKGRLTHFTRYGDAMGRFTFHDLCEKALGAVDYLALAQRLDTVILTGIPRLPPEKRNEAKRFVTLIDALYEHKVKLICTAETPPEGIYAHGDGSFEFARTVSRLAEMGSGKWLEP